MSISQEPNSTETLVRELQEDEEPPSLQSTLMDTSIETEEDIPFNTRPNGGISPQSERFLKAWYPDATKSQWIDWRWQLRNSITKPEQLIRLLHEFEPNSTNQSLKRLLPLRITPYYASLIWESEPSNPLRKTVVPSGSELILSKGESPDPLHEENDSPIPNLVHRYPDRVLFLATGFCSAYCRYCTRTHMVSKKDKCHSGVKAWEPALEYIANHHEVRDVLISGGDPLTMPDSHIKYLLMRLRAIRHVEIIRIGTKVPVVLPMRITKAFASMLRKFHPLYISIHFTHPDELTPETALACERLADAGIPLGSQTVLLKEINDNVETMKALMQGLLKIRVRPYYLYQCDPIPGSLHFRTPVKKGLEIIQGLRGFTSGYAIPHYVIDAPGGGGKIPLLPDYFHGHNQNGDVVLSNYQGKTYFYPDIL
ncbi:MAG TPA: KamA family radical SAM protein [Bacteroidales bacterium]|nr:KamA family radical SAM protein [Bacteroidales bacterium]HPR58262.1 KamA family radical SAM protein [Bacteroidales bacterium]HRW96020.1 KamA family radical SAM protein [Bacteroidales bacterium]